jgi:hypothetical protein
MPSTPDHKTDHREEKQFVATGTSLPLGESRTAWVYVASDKDGNELDRIIVIAGTERPEGELLASEDKCTCGYERHWKHCPEYVEADHG